MALEISKRLNKKTNEGIGDNSNKKQQPNKNESTNIGIK